jgi:hypothetical protein
VCGMALTNAKMSGKKDMSSNRQSCGVSTRAQNN